MRLTARTKAPFSLIIASITLSRTWLVPFKAKSLRSQALYLFIKRLNFLSVSCALGFRRIGAAQFFQCFLNGEFGCLSHGNPRIQATKGQTIAEPRQSKSWAPATATESPGRSENCALMSAKLITWGPTRAAVDLDQHQLRSGDLFYAQCPLRDRMTVSSTRRRNIFERRSDCREAAMHHIATLRQTLTDERSSGTKP
jgi:hypothetical protein